MADATQIALMSERLKKVEDTVETIETEVSKIGNTMSELRFALLGNEYTKGGALKQMNEVAGMLIEVQKNHTAQIKALKTEIDNENKILKDRVFKMEQKHQQIKWTAAGWTAGIAVTSGIIFLLIKKLFHL